MGVNDMVYEAAGGGLAALHEPESLQNDGPVGSPDPRDRQRRPGEQHVTGGGARHQALSTEPTERNFATRLQIGLVWVLPLAFNPIYTDKKENQIFLIYKKIQNGAVAKSYI
jgi:hypothetical protein